MKIARFNIDFTATSAAMRNTFKQVGQEAAKLKTTVSKAFSGFVPIKSFTDVHFIVKDLVALFGSAAAEIDKIGKTAERLGIAAETMGALEVASRRSGVQFDQTTIAIQRMSRRIAEVAQYGRGVAAPALEELGLSARVLVNQDVDVVLGRIGDAMANVNRQSDRVRLAFQLFDSEGVKLLNTIDGGSEAMKGFREEAKRLGITLSQDQIQNIERFDDALARWGDAWTGAKRKAAATTAPTAEYLVSREFFKESFIDPEMWRKGSREIATWLLWFRKIGEGDPQRLKAYDQAIKDLQENFTGYGAGGKKGLGALADTAAPEPFVARSGLNAALAQQLGARSASQIRAQAAPIIDGYRNLARQITDAFSKEVERRPLDEILLRYQLRGLPTAFSRIWEGVRQAATGVGNATALLGRRQTVQTGGAAFLQGGSAAAFAARMRGVTDTQRLLRVNDKTAKNTGKTVTVLEAVEKAIKEAGRRIIIDAPQGA